MQASTATLLALGVITVSIVAVNGINIVATDVPDAPIEILSAVALNSPVEKGGVLRSRLEVKKNRDCPAEYDLFFISDTGDLKTAGTVKGGKFQVGITTLTFDRILPMSVVPGRWLYKIVGRAKCPGEPWTWPVPHPLIAFEVTDPPEPDKDGL